MSTMPYEHNGTADCSSDVLEGVDALTEAFATEVANLRHSIVRDQLHAYLACVAHADRQVGCPPPRVYLATTCAGSGARAACSPAS